MIFLIKLLSAFVIPNYVMESIYNCITKWEWGRKWHKCGVQMLTNVKHQCTF